MSYFVAFREIDAEGIEEELSRLKGQVLTLANFLMDNFRDDLGAGDGDFETATEMAIRLLTELEECRPPTVQQRRRMRAAARSAWRKTWGGK